MEAPHVFSGGTMCHGNLITAITEAYKDRDLFKILICLVTFLESANVDDPAGKYVSKWPIVESIPSAEDESVEIVDDVDDDEFISNLSLKGK